MTDLRDHDPLVEAVAKARKAVSQRPDIKFPTGGLNIINGRVYSYSGAIEFAGTETLILEFVTGSDTLELECQMGVDGYDGDDMDVGIKLNDTQVLLNRSAVTGTSGLVKGLRWDLIIPPFTNFKFTAQNKTDASTYDAYALVVGTVI